MKRFRLASDLSPRLPESTSEQGVTLWLVILILGFALAASLGASALVLGEVKQTRIISDSVAAFFAADAGAEQALYKLCKQNNRTNQNNQPVGSAQYSYEVAQGGGALTVVSTGSFRSSRRAVELTGFTEDAGVVDCGQAGVGGGASALTRWKMDETANDQCGAGKDVCDTVGTNHGDAVGTTIVSGISGNARSLNGTSDYISIPDSNVLGLTNKATIIAWIKRSALGTQDVIISKYNSTDAFGQSFIFQLTADGKLYGAFYTNSSNVLRHTSLVAITDTNWHAVAYALGTSVAGPTVAMYIDGVQVGTADTSSGTFTNLQINGIPVEIGRLTDGLGATAPYMFGGTIDEVVIYNATLTATQICDIYKAQSGQPSCGPPPDTTPPAAITNLAASGATASSINLNWTAPGDDGSTGTATSYDVRYSTSAITDANWGSATQATGEPTPLVAGTAQSMTVSGLAPSTLYYFAIKTSDEVPNTSGLSNVVSRTTLSVPDTTPPAAITNLAASGETSSSVNLSWTAPGDDGAAGTAASYDVRYSTSAITDANWASATQATGEPTPLVAGSAQSMTVSGLSPSTTYYFAIKTLDEVPNISALSNVPSLSTAPAAIAFDSSAATPTQCTSPSSFTITTAQPNEVVLLGVMVSNGAGGVPPTATLDGVAMTPIQTVVAGSDSTGYLRLLWGVAPSAGLHTIIATVSFSGGNCWSATAMALQNVNTTSPVDVSVGNTASQIGSLTTTVANTWVISVGGYSSTLLGSNITFAGGFTERIDSLVPAEVAMATLPAPTPGLYSSSWSTSTPISGAAATIMAAVKL